jgi:hypothetical protein
MPRNVIVLALAQFFGAFGQVATVLLAGLIGTSLAPAPHLATVPVGTAVIGIAAATIPVGLDATVRRPVLFTGSLISCGRVAGCSLGNMISSLLRRDLCGRLHLAFTAVSVRCG